MPSGPPSRPKPECFDAAERRGRVGDDALVEADHAGLERLGDAERAGEVLGEDVGDQAVLGVVGHARAPRPRSSNVKIGATGPKISSRSIRRRPADVGQHGRRRRSSRRRRARAAGERPWRRAPTASSTSSATLSRCVARRPAGRPRRRPRCRGRRVSAPIRSASRRANSSATDCVHDEPVGGRAGLADVAHLGQHRAVDRRVEVGVVEDEERRVAAELHRDPQQLLGALLEQRAADPVEPVKVSLRSRGSRDERLHDRARCGRGDDVEHAVGQPGLGAGCRRAASIDSGVSAGGLDAPSCSRRRWPGRSCGCPWPAGSSTA